MRGRSAQWGSGEAERPKRKMETGRRAWIVEGVEMEADAERMKENRRGRRSIMVQGKPRREKGVLRYEFEGGGW
jgi:hypothetical protein